jgi:hypothetical protein
MNHEDQAWTHQNADEAPVQPQPCLAPFQGREPNCALKFLFSLFLSEKLLEDIFVVNHCTISVLNLNYDNVCNIKIYHLNHLGAVFGIKFREFPIVGKHCNTKIHSQPLVFRNKVSPCSLVWP